MNVTVDAEAVLVTWINPEEAGRAFDVLCLRFKAEFGDVPMELRGNVHNKVSLVTPNWVQGRLTKC